MVGFNDKAAKEKPKAGLIVIPVAKIKRQAEKNAVLVVALAAKNEQSIRSADPHQRRVVSEATMARNLKQEKKDETTIKRVEAIS